MRRTCGLMLIVAFFWIPGGLQGQLSATIGYARTGYSGGDYAATRGDWQGEAVAKYQFSGPLRLGFGVGIGKLDEPYSDRSFSTIAAFIEPSVGFSVGESLTAAVGGRYGLAQERLAGRSSGYWAFGSEAGGAATIDYTLKPGLGLGLQVEVVNLDLRRDEHLLARPGGLDREGWRTSVGAFLRFGAA